MKDDKNNIVKTNLDKLVKKYAKSDVIYAMEREYQTVPVFFAPIEVIDDSPYLSAIILPEELIDELANSFKKGVTIDPLVVRKQKDRYEVVMGRKRLAAAKKAGIERLPLSVRDYTDEETLLTLLAVARDEHRVSPLELALVFRELNTKFAYTQSALAALAHQSRPQVTNIIRLLNLPQVVIDALAVGKISYGHARALCTLTPSQAEKMVTEIVSKNLTVRACEEKIQLLNGKKKKIGEQGIYHGYSLTVLRRQNRVNIVFNNNKDAEKFLIELLGKK